MNVMKVLLRIENPGNSRGIYTLHIHYCCIVTGKFKAAYKNAG
jgi:hypothetical protein